MKEYQVICLEEYGRAVDEAKVEGAINEMVSRGWDYLQMATGGGGESGYFVSWVYLIFTREK